MRKSLILLIVIVMVFMSGCVNNNVEKNAENVVKVKENVNVNVAVPAGSTALSMVKMIKEGVDIEGYSVNIEVIKATDLLASKVMSGEVDMIVLPTNLAAKLYNKGVDYSLDSVNIWGSLFLVSNNDISNISELSGKTVTMIGKGLTPDILMNYILNENNVKDVNFNFVSGGSELAPLYLSGKSEISMMPEPVLSVIMTKKPDTKIILDFQEEWKNITGLSTSYPQAGLFTKNEFKNKNSEFVDKFLQEYEKSNEWVNKNKVEAGVYYEELDLGVSAKIIEKSIERSNIRFMNANDAKDSLNKYFEVLYSTDENSIGGKIPDDNFYGN